MSLPGAPLGVVPILIGPLQVLVALLPAIAAAVGGLILALFKPATAKKAVLLLWRLKLFVVAIAGVTVGAVYAIGWAFPGYGGPVTQQEASAADWPIFRGGLARTGSVPGTDSPTQGGVNWAFTGEKAFLASPAAVGNRLYITSASKGVFEDAGAIYCLDADTGGVAWKSRPSGFLATFSSPAVHGKYLVSGEGLHFTRNARVVCLDIDRQGKLLWEYRTASHVESTPCIANGRAYIGAGDDGYYCFELEPDPNGRPKMVWHVPGEKYPDAETSPAVADGKVYVGLGMGGNAVCCLDAGDGREIWRVATPYPVFTPPTIAGGCVYVGMGNGNFINSAEEVRAQQIDKLKKQGKTRQEIAEAEKGLAPAGEVWCLDAAGGEVRWRFKTPRTILGAIAADVDASGASPQPGGARRGNRGRLYFATRGGSAYCLSADGRQIAVWHAYEPVLASPAVTGQCVYYVTDGGKLYALDKTSFEPRWETTLGTDGRFISSPVVARGRLYVGTQNHGFLCVGRPGGGAGPPPLWCGWLGGPGKTGLADAEPLPARAALLWRYPPKPAENQAQERLVVVAPAAVLGQALYVPVADGPKKGLLCLKNDPAGRRQETPPVAWHFPAPNGVVLSPAGNEDRIFVVDSPPGQADRHLHCLRAETGEPLWRRPVAPDASGRLVFTGRFLLIHDAADTLTCLDAEGNPVWRRRTGPLAGSAAWQDLIAVAAVQEPAELLAMDLPTGEPLWRISLGGAPAFGPAVRKNVIYTAAGKGIAARSLIDGTLEWQVDAGGAAGRFVVDGTHLAYFNTAGELVVLKLKAEGEEVPKEVADRLDREVGLDNATPGQVIEAVGKWRTRLKVAVAGARADLPPLLTRDGVIYASSRGLMMQEFSADRPRRWMSTSLLGNVTSPMIAARSCVYFGCERRGFVCGGRWRE